MKRILEFISQYLQTEGGRDYLKNISEENDIEKIKERFEEFKRYSVLLRKKNFLLPDFKKLEAGTSISKYFVWFRNYLRDVIEIRREIENLKEDADSYLPFDYEILSFYQKLEMTFDDEGNIKDTASQILREIREKKRELYQEIERKIKISIEKFKKENILRDEEIYYKEGRFTICLKTLPQNVKLIAYSRSGESYFVEPEDIVIFNSKFRHYEDMEKEEERKILNQIFSEYNDLKEEISELVYYISKLDYYTSLFLFTNKISGEIPQFGKEKKFKLINTYHPLLKIKLQNKCVPYTIEIPEKESVLLVTGPNGGGKTTFLETIYLLIEMIKRGIPVPSSSQSYFYIPEKIFMAGFEERSKIEEGFSSFTLYLEEIKKSLSESFQDKLVLLDEFMGNTDPEEGGNLGVGILREYRDKNIKTICATHNDKIKSYLREEKGVLISAFTLDLDVLSPTYKIELMKISPSYALLVARKCNLPESIFEKMPESTEIIDRIYRMKAEIDKEKKELEKERENLKKEREKLESEYKKELKRKIEEWSKEINKILKEFEEKKDKRILKKAIQRIEEKKTEVEERIPSRLEIGNFYSVKESSVKGKLLEIKGDKAVLDVKGKKMEVPVSYLREPTEEKIQKEIDINLYSIPLPSRVLSIRGMEKEEAEELVERFLYDARAAGYNEVRIVHGEGKGILKKMVFDVIKNIDFVEEYFHPSWNEGGDGVTVIRFKKT
ncbi:MAG: Smr/MutS family protein [candidate division WOR-3 bacterium]